MYYSAYLIKWSLSFSKSFYHATSFKFLENSFTYFQSLASQFQKNSYLIENEILISFSVEAVVVVFYYEGSSEVFYLTYFYFCLEFDG